MRIAMGALCALALALLAQSGVHAAFANATSSLTVRAGTEGLTTRMVGEMDRTDMGAKSR